MELDIMGLRSRQLKRAVRWLLQPILRNRYLRIPLLPYMYRRWIGPGEAVAALQRHRDRLDASYWAGALRQYAHIVDKGLHNRTFSAERGRKAYLSAKESLGHVTSAEARRDPCVAWAAHKLEQRERLESNGAGGLRAPYQETVCTYEDLLDAIQTRRSIRYYTEAPVEDEVIERITDVLDWAPTSCHRQPGSVYATNDPERVQQCLRQHAGAACFKGIHAPLFLVFCTDMRFYEMPVELIAPYLDVAFGVQNCVLAAHTLGVSITLLSWATRTDQQERRLREILDIPPHLQIVVSGVGGYPDGGAEVPLRKRKQLFIRRAGAQVETSAYAQADRRQRSHQQARGRLVTP